MDIFSFYKISNKIILSLFIMNFFISNIKSQQPYNTHYLEKYSCFIAVYSDRIIFNHYEGKITGEQSSLSFDTDEQKITSSDEDNMISIGNFYTNDYQITYVIVKNYIYFGICGIIDKKINIDNIGNRPSIIVPYQCAYISEQYQSYCFFFICLIDSDKKLRIYEYNNIYGQETLNCINNKTIDLIDSSGMTSLSGSDIVTCQIMTYNSNQVLVCFYENEKTEIGTIVLNIETLEPDNSKQSIFKKNSGATNMKSILFNNSEKAFICYINNYNNIACIIFNLNTNELEKEYKYLEKMSQSQRFFNIEYFESVDKFILSCYSSSNEFEYLILDNQTNIVDNSFNDGKYCLTNITMETCTEDSLPFISIYYDSGNLKMAKKCGYAGNFSYLSLSESCNKAYDRVELTSNDDNETVSSLTNSDEITNEISESSGIKKSKELKLKSNKIETNKTLELVVNNLDKLIEEVEQGQLYEIKGDNYLVNVCPINYNKFEQTLTYINFLNCENTLRNKYNLSPNDNLTEIMIEITINDENSLTNQVEYAVFYGKKQLNLSICENDKIEVNYNIINSTSINLDMILKFSEIGVDILNSKDTFFTDICFPYSENNSDIILKDRTLCVYQNFSKCDENCEYEKIDLDSLIITCKCSIKTEVESEIKQLRFDTILLDLITNSSFGVVKCYNLVFNYSKKENIGFYIFTLLICLHIPLYIHYYRKNINQINRYIISEMKKYFYINNINNPNKKKQSKKINGVKYKIYKTNFPQNNEKQKNLSSSNYNISIANIKNIDTPKNKLVCKSKRNSLKYINIYNKQKNKRDNKKKQNTFIYTEVKKVNKKSKKNKTKLIKSKSSDSIIEEKINNNKNIYCLIQIDANNSFNKEPPNSKIILDNYSYEEAIKYEKRSFWSIYYIVLITKENILNIILLNSPLELTSLRLCIIIFIYSCDLSLNTLFYFNDNISEKFHYDGNNLFLFTLFNNISISIISTSLSLGLVIFLQYLTNSKEDIEDLFRTEEKKMREDNNYNVSKKRGKEILITIFEINKKLKIKIIFFFIIEMLLMLFFYYFVTAFCEVYKETQISWITDSVVSFIIGFPIEFLFSLLISVLYIISVEKKFKWLYNFTMFLYHLG